MSISITAFAQDSGHLVAVPQPIPPLAITLDQPEHHTDPSNRAQENRGTEKNPIIVKELPRDRSEDEQREAKEKAELDRKVTNFTGDLAFYTKFLMVVTALLALGTGWLAWVASRQMKEARGSIAAAKRAADAAENALTVVERAFLAVDSIGIENIHGIPIIAKTKIANTGNLPARGVRWIVYGGVDKNPRQRTFGINRDAIEPSNNIIAPRSAMIRFTDITSDVTPTDIYDVYQQTKVLYIWGIVYYFDGISPIERWTCFCHRYEADCIRGGDDNITDERVRQHQFGNGTDEYPQSENA